MIVVILTEENTLKQVGGYTQMISSEGLGFLDILGTIAFAISGTQMPIKREMDVFG